MIFWKIILFGLLKDSDMIYYHINNRKIFDMIQVYENEIPSEIIVELKQAHPNIVEFIFDFDFHSAYAQVSRWTSSPTIISKLQTSVDSDFVHVEHGGKTTPIIFTSETYVKAEKFSFEIELFDNMGFITQCLKSETIVDKRDLLNITTKGE